MLKIWIRWLKIIRLCLINKLYLIVGFLIHTGCCERDNKKGVIVFHFFDEMQDNNFDRNEYIERWLLDKIAILFQNTKLEGSSVDRFRETINNFVTHNKQIGYYEVAKENDVNNNAYIRGVMFYEGKSQSLQYHVIVTLDDDIVRGMWVMPGNAESATAIYTRIAGSGKWHGTKFIGAATKPLK